MLDKKNNIIVLRRQPITIIIILNVEISPKNRIENPIRLPFYHTKKMFILHNNYGKIALETIDSEGI